MGNIKEKDVDEDNCPKCGEYLNFCKFEIDDGLTGYYPCFCGKCEFEGRQWYVLKFDAMQEKIKDGTFEDLP